MPIETWCRAIGRRVESQFQRDWTLCFTMWNYMFRTAINLSKSVISLKPAKETGLTDLTARDIDEGGRAILKALGGKYCTPAGRLEAVNGDLSKVRYAENELPPAAHRTLTNIQHISRQIGGTQEVRALAILGISTKSPAS